MSIALKATAARCLATRTQHQSVSQLRRELSADVPRRRVVVTGVGVVSPVGCNVPTAWKNINAGACGVDRLTDPAYATLPCRIAARIPADDLKLENHFSKSELRAIAPATAYALIAGNGPA